MKNSRQILDDGNLNTKKKTVEERSTNREIFNFLRVFHFVVGGSLVVVNLMWIYVIGLAYMEIGRIPEMFDSTNAMRNPLGINDMVLFNSGLYMFFGIAYWTIHLIIVFIGRIYTPKKSTICIGIVSVICYVLILMSSAYGWVLDV